MAFSCFPRLASAARFPAVATSCSLSRGWHQLLIFPRLAPAAGFPALATGRSFSRSWHRRLHVWLGSTDPFITLLLICCDWADFITLPVFFRKVIKDCSNTHNPSLSHVTSPLDSLYVRLQSIWPALECVSYFGHRRSQERTDCFAVVFRCSAPKQEKNKHVISLFY